MIALAPEIRFITFRDGYRAAARVWDVLRPAARIIFVHGIISHSGWYLASCRHLAQAGFEVHFLDRRGSGLNAAARGDVDRQETWLDDVETYLTALPADVPRLLIGISWGGKLVAAFARQRPELIAGIGMLCPGLFARQMPGPFARGAVALAGRLGLDERQVTIPLQQPELFTESLAWQSYIRNDPFTLRQVTLRFARADQRLTEFARTAPEQIRLPLLLMLAGRERIVDNRATRAFFDRVGSQDKQLIEYPEAAHTLEFEPDPTSYFNDLTNWVRRAATGCAP